MWFVFYISLLGSPLYLSGVTVINIPTSAVVITVPIKVDAVSDVVVNVKGSHVALDAAKERGKIAETK